MCTHIYNVSAILSADNIKYTNVFLPYSFLSSFFKLREREREYVIAVLRKGGGRNILNVYLAFWRVPSESIFFNGLMGFYGARLEASAISCSRAPFCFFTRSFGYSVHTSCHTNCCPKTDFFLSISTDEEKATSVFRVLANHSASFSFLHPVRRFVRTPISSTWVRLWGTDSLTYILYFLQ